MAITGAELDLYKRMYSDTIEAELQQNGSLLENTVSVQRVSGERAVFMRKAAAQEAQIITDEFAPLAIVKGNYESRWVTRDILSANETIDANHFEMVAADPRNMIVQGLVDSLGRAKDRIILRALGGSANRQVSGSSSSASFDSNNTIAVGDTSYTTGTPGNMLHEGKLESALNILGQNHVDTSKSQVVCVASMKQLSRLAFRLESLGQLRGDFLGDHRLLLPGADKRLGMYKGVQFIASELLTESEFLTSTNEYAYFYVMDGVKLGVWADLNMYIDRLVQYVDQPYQFAATTHAGAVRMDEAKVVRAICATSV